MSLWYGLDGFHGGVYIYRGLDYALSFSLVGKVGNMIKKLWGKFLCLVGDHDWTGDALRGIEPSKEIVALAKVDPVAGFRKYSKMYCKRCGKISTL